MNKQLFLISDTHFGHFNIIKYCDRPFHSTKEMNESMIENWNKTVGKEDYVIHLGDFGLGGVEALQNIVSQLNGRIILVKGNHDHFGETKSARLGFYKFYKGPVSLKTVVEDVMALDDDTGWTLDKESAHLEGIILNHQPLEDFEGDEVVFHGHIHNHEFEKANHVNLSVEKIGYTPINLDELIRQHR